MGSTWPEIALAASDARNSASEATSLGSTSCLSDWLAIAISLTSSTLFPLAWARQYGRGRVWFTGLAHRANTWDSAAFQAMLLGGLEWVGRRIDADLTPNLDAVAPGVHVFPPEREGT